MKNAHPSARQGFTLIELLMVVLIVGLLSGLLLVAVTAGVRKAQEAAVATELEQMSMAVESFKNDKGAYPLSGGWAFKSTPATTDSNYGPRFMRTVSKVFPRYAANYAEFRTHVNSGTLHVRAGGLDISTLDQAESLVFWLGGLPDLDSETKLIGFRNDPSQPFQYPFDDTKPIDHPDNVVARNKNRQQPRFAFDPSRLVDYDNDGWWEYIPKQKPTLAPLMAPYVYFDSPSYDLMPFYPTPVATPLDQAVNISDTAAAIVWGNGSRSSPRCARSRRRTASATGRIRSRTSAACSS